MAKVDDDLAAAKAERDQLRSERAQLLADTRAAEKAQREAEGRANDAGRQLAAAAERVAAAEAKAEEHRQGVLARDWQLEQQRELARQVKILADALTQPVLGAMQGDGRMVELPPGADPRAYSRGVPVDRGPMTEDERARFEHRLGNDP